MFNGNLWGLIHNAANAGVLMGGRPYTPNFYYVGSNAPRYGQQVDTIKEAIALMISGDILLLGPQSYAEGNITIPKALTNISIIGSGGGYNEHRSSIEPPDASDNGFLIYGNGCSFYNLDLQDGGAGSYAVKVGDNLTDGQNVQRFHAYGCKFEGGSVGLYLQGSADILVEESEFAWAPSGIVLQSNNHGFATEIFIRRSKFHNFATVGIGEAAAAQQVDTLEVSDCIFDNAEDGTAPTHFINLSDNGNTGIITRNSFAIATNAVAKLVVGTGIKWVANATEAGWSTGRPA